jgi:hypothetical protein
LTLLAIGLDRAISRLVVPGNRLRARHDAGDVRIEVGILIAGLILLSAALSAALGFFFALSLALALTLTASDVGWISTH